MAAAKFTPDFYVYVHRRASDGSVFYVGKGNGKRAWAKQGRSRYWHNIAAKHGYTVEIVQAGMQEWWAFELECELIASYGRATLCNLTNGGDGPSEPKPESFKQFMRDNNPMKSKENRDKVSAAKKGMKRPDLSTNPILLRPGIKNKISGANHVRARKVVCLDNGLIFDTVTSASLWLRSIGYTKASNGDIVKCCKGKAKKSHKHRFAYA